jgi:hypothetical protein
VKRRVPGKTITKRRRMQKKRLLQPALAALLSMD